MAIKELGYTLSEINEYFNDIKIENKKVNWGKNCEACLGCYHWCPKKAIELSNYTGDKVRRTNPNISIEEMIID